MRVEVPEFKRCCCCLPLRWSLIVYGYIKLIMDNFAAIFSITSTASAYMRSPQWHTRLVLITVIAIVVTVTLMENVFTTILIIAGYRKSPRLLKVSYVYTIVSFVLLILVDLLIGYFDLHLRLTILDWTYRKVTLEVALTLSYMFFQLFLGAYLILLIRSEMLKLSRQQLEVQFINNEAQAEVCLRGAESEIVESNN